MQILPYTSIAIPADGSITLLDLTVELLTHVVFQAPLLGVQRVLIQGCTIIMPLCNRQGEGSFVKQIGEMYGMTTLSRLVCHHSCAVLLPSELYKLFLGYFDPVVISLCNKNR